MKHLCVIPENVQKNMHVPVLSANRRAVILLRSNVASVSVMFGIMEGKCTSATSVGSGVARTTSSNIRLCVRLSRVTVSSVFHVTSEVSGLACDAR